MFRVIGFLGYDPLPVEGDFPSRLKALRRRLGLTQAGLARRLAVDDSTVRGWEVGEHPPRLRSGVALDALFRDVGLANSSPEEGPNSFAERVRTARRARGWDQVELARRLGVSRETVSEWERDRTSPRRGHLERLEALLGNLGPCDEGA